MWIEEIRIYWLGWSKLALMLTNGVMIMFKKEIKLIFKFTSKVIDTMILVQNIKN